MNSFLFYTNIFLLACFSAANATIITVDNSQGSTAEHETIASAISSATSGDTIYVHASVTGYGNFQINKRLVILGPGHHSVRPEKVNAKLGDVTLKNGASSTVIKGFEIGKIIKPSTDLVHDVVLENNYFTGGYYAIQIQAGGTFSASDWVIRGNVFNPLTSCGGCSLINLDNNTRILNWVIHNNIIRSIPPCCGGTSELFSGLGATTLLTNNVIVANSTSIMFEKSNPKSSDATFTNNIFVINSTGVTDIAQDCENCIFENNLTYTTLEPLADLPGDNLNNAELSFVNVPDFSKWSIDDDFRLTDGSDGTEAGTDGTDVGVYGGSYVFKKHGSPQGIPVITSFKIKNPVIAAGEELILELSATSDN